MAGEANTPALAAAVSNAGGLGSLGVAYMPPDAVRETIRAVRALTARPFGINLFVPIANTATPEQLARARALLAGWRAKYQLADDAPTLTMPDFEQQFAVVLEEKPPVVSFTFGSLARDKIAVLKKLGVAVVGTATTVPEAERLEQDGVDAVVAQGTEAGAHRGTFLASFEDSQIGLMALVPAMTDRVRIPVIAAGGIMDGRGIAAALMLGAAGVQLGTAFLVTDESGASAAWRDAILKRRADETSVTRAFSGRAARGIRNAFMAEIGAHESELPPFPAMNGMTRGIRSAATKRGDPDALSLWAGQGAPLARSMEARDLLRLLVTETSQRLDEAFQG